MKNMTKAELLALVESLTAEAEASPKASPKATAKPKASPQVPRVVNLAKSLTRGISVNGQRVEGQTFAVWYVTGPATRANNANKRTAVITGSYIAITRQGCTEEQAKALVTAWQNLAPKARKNVTMVAFKDAWLAKVEG